MAQERKQFILKATDIKGDIHSVEIFEPKEKIQSKLEETTETTDRFIHISDDKIINLNNIVSIEIVD